MPESQLFSDGVDTLLQMVRPHARSETCFPQKLDDFQSRRRSGETLHDWFKRLIDNFCGGEPKLAAIEDNIAVFAILRWKNRKRLDYASIQTIVATSDLEEYYLAGGVEAQYLRLDFDYKTLGDPFSHPLAHIHVGNAPSPRFALDGNSGNVVVDYLEFVYRNFVPTKWVQWAEREWGKVFVEQMHAGEVNYFATIIDAFRTSQFPVLREHSNLLVRIKGSLRKRKDEAFAYTLEPADRELLEYPLSR